MKVVLQRVSEAHVEVQKKITGKIGLGMMLLVGVDQEDESHDADWLIKKIIGLRIFPDQEGKMNLSIREVSGSFLCISQFTLLADYKKGNRPSFIKAAQPEKAQFLFDYFKSSLQKESGLLVESGVFGADMKVSLVNDGPVTLVIDSKTKL